MEKRAGPQGKRLDRVLKDEAGPGGRGNEGAEPWGRGGPRGGAQPGRKEDAHPSVPLRVPLTLLPCACVPCKPGICAGEVPVPPGRLAELVSTGGAHPHGPWCTEQNAFPTWVGKIGGEHYLACHVYTVPHPNPERLL